MKRLHLFHIFLFYNIFSLWAQPDWSEKVYVHLDKDCYIAGEEIQLKFVVMGTDYNLSSFSKVGYVEICDTEKPYIQLKLALDKGAGAGKVVIPPNVPSGIYQLSAYTRYMKNGGEQSFFRRQLAVINMNRHSESDRLELIEGKVGFGEIEQERSTIKVSTDKDVYANRHQVKLSLSQLPADLSELVVSVTRNDSIAYIPGVHKKNWLEDVPRKTSITDPWEWVPEYEGHIITGRIEPVGGGNKDLSNANIAANIGFVGNGIRYIQGQRRGDDLFCFYTGGIYGSQEVVTSVVSYDDSAYRMQLVSPYSESLPESLPPLRILSGNEKMMDRFIGMQLRGIIGVDSLENPVPLDKYYYYRDPVVYNLDEYTRFNTLGETIIEYVQQVVVRKGRLDKRAFRVLIPEEKRFSSGNTLVLLDGIAIHDHEEMLKYNPRNIHTMRIYNGRYLFGNEMYECMISFVTHRGNLPAIQLNDSYQLLAYDCPVLPEEFEMPAYTDEQAKKSLKPDFRHTLYWNPLAETEVKDASALFSFYTSDLSGEFKVTVEGFTKGGRSVYGTSCFMVSF